MSKNYTPDAYGFAPKLAPLTFTMGAVEGGGLLVRAMHGGKLGLSHMNLLGAAPDLLAALVGLVADFERVNGRSIEPEHEAHAAILKAGGSL
jgi:hypothetical protein